MQEKESTRANRAKKAERRNAKAVRKAANKKEDKKKNPNNVLLGILIIGILLGAFTFAVGHDYFHKPKNIETYMKDNGYTEMYTNMPISEYTTTTMRADGNAMKILFKVSEDAPKEELKTFQGDDGKEYLKTVGSTMLMTMKPETQGLTGSVKVGVKQGDKTINYVKMSYHEAKKFAKEAAEDVEIDETESAQK